MVAVTGYTHLRERCRAAGIEHCYIKPFEASALEELLATHANKLAGVYMASWRGHLHGK